MSLATGLALRLAAWRAASFCRAFCVFALDGFLALAAVFAFIVVFAAAGACIRALVRAALPTIPSTYYLRT